jgi:predicted O-methyltransferase YrrM
MEMRSSYIKNDFGSVFRALILSHKPKLAVECGVLDGYSTFHIAHAIRFNRITRDIKCPFFAYDLWEEYDYKHGDFIEVENMLEERGLGDYCNLTEGDAFEVVDIFDRGSVDFLHMDISNNGDTLLKTIQVWGKKISTNGVIAFEGGSEERDNVEWMLKYDFRSIRDVLMNEPEVYENWAFQVFNTFPSMTLLWKK